MVLFRIVKCIYAEDITGTGARLYGGRWNSEGKPMLYMASSRSLAVLEVLVHLPPLMIPDGYCLTEIEVPNDSVSHLEIEDLPANWKTIAQPTSLKEIGDRFLKNQEHLLLRIPSAIVPAEHNYLMNPNHKAFKKVRVLKTESFDFDERLI